MSLITKGVGIALLAACMAPPSIAGPRGGVPRAAFGPRASIGTRIIVSPRVFGPSYAPFGGYGYYYGSGPYYPGYALQSNTGEVKINTHMKDASLYVDGGYVGPVSKFKKFSLRPGNYDIELRDAAGAHIFDERIHVIFGKSIELKPAS